MVLKLHKKLQAIRLEMKKRKNNTKSWSSMKRVKSLLHVLLRKHYFSEEEARVLATLLDIDQEDFRIRCVSGSPLEQFL